MVCKECGANVVLLKEANGVKTYKCNYCGSTFEEAVKKEPPAPVAPVKTAEPAPKKGDVLTGREIYAKTVVSTVEIHTEEGSASGFFVSDAGFVITNAHAVILTSGGLCSNIYIRTKEGKKHDAILIAVGKPNGEGIDLALLFVPDMCNNVKGVEMGDSSKAENGETIYYIGNSQAEGLSITSGIISDNKRMIGNQVFIMTDAATNPGNSGGPLVNEKGQVIGVHVSARAHTDGMKYAIPINIAKEFIGYVERKTDINTNALPESRTQNEELVTLIFSGVKIIVDAVEWIIKAIRAKKARA